MVNVGGGKDLTTAICPLKETKDLRKKINCFFFWSWLRFKNTPVVVQRRTAGVRGIKFLELSILHNL